MIMPQLTAQFPQLIASMQSIRAMILTMHSTMSGFIATMNESTENVTAMGQAFDASRNDDSFFLPPEVFDNEDFKRRWNRFCLPTENPPDSSFRIAVIRPDTGD